MGDAVAEGQDQDSSCQQIRAKMCVCMTRRKEVMDRLQRVSLEPHSKRSPAEPLKGFALLLFSFVLEISSGSQRAITLTEVSGQDTLYSPSGVCASKGRHTDRKCTGFYSNVVVAVFPPLWLGSDLRVLVSD